MKPTPDTARTTGNAIDAALRLADHSAQLWRDPAFREWEYGQIGHLERTRIRPGSETLTRFLAYPGPEHSEADPDYGGSGSVHIRPMAALAPHLCACNEDDDPGDDDWEEHEASLLWRVRRDEYPPPGQTTYGPLLLGPEPEGPITRPAREGARGPRRDTT